MTDVRHLGPPERRGVGAPGGPPAGPPDAGGAFTHRQVMTILAGLLLGMFLASLDQTVVSTAIRTVADDLHGYDLQAWATTAFLITSTIANPLYGKLSDLYGRRPFYLFAIGAFVAGSALCGLAGSMYELAAFRAVQGIGAGGLMSMAMAIVGDIVPPRERSRYQGWFMAVFGTSSVLGPVVGGALSGQASILGITGWRWIFYVNVPLGIAAFVVVLRNLHLPHTRREHRIDVPGALALLVCLVPLLVVAEQGRTWGWTSAASGACYAVGAVGLAAFVLAERSYGDDALLPLRLFGNRTFAVTTTASLLVGAGMFGGILLLPQYLQIVHGSSPTLAGLQMIPLALGIMIGSIVAGRTIARTGRYKPFPIVGVVLMVTALTTMSFVVSGTTSWLALALLMLPLGLGLGFNFQPVVVAVQNAVSPREIGVATSSVTSFRQMGGTIGTAVFLSVLFSTLPGAIADAYTDARSSAAFQQAAATHRDQLQGLPGVGANFGDTSFVQRLDPALAAPFRSGFAESIDRVFLVAACVVALGLLVLVFLPQLVLRTQSGIQAAQQAAAGPTTAGPPAAGSGSGGHATDIPDPCRGPLRLPQDDPHEPQRSAVVTSTPGIVVGLRFWPLRLTRAINGTRRSRLSGCVETDGTRSPRPPGDAGNPQSSSAASVMTVGLGDRRPLERMPYMPSDQPFNVVLLGYSRVQVAEMIKHLESDIEHATAERDAAMRELAMQVSGLRQEIAAQHIKAASAGPATNTGERIFGILALAEEEAEDIRQAAKKEAKETDRAAQQLMAQAQARADELMAQAKERIAHMDAEARDRRRKFEEDFDLAQRTRRAEAARQEERRVQAVAATAQQLMAASQFAAEAAAAVQALLPEQPSPRTASSRPQPDGNKPSAPATA
jgi:EmrB/QacA subfamily drug resistance transporter